MSNRFIFEEELFDTNTVAVSKENIKNSCTYLFFKRIVDLVGALLGIIILLPVFVIIAIAIKIEDPNGNIFFGHDRVGKNGKPFKCCNSSSKSSAL